MSQINILSSLTSSSCSSCCSRSSSSSSCSSSSSSSSCCGCCLSSAAVTQVKPQSAMKFVVQLVGNFLRAVLASCQKLLTQHKLNFVDVCVFCTTVFLAVSYYYHWCLILAFVCMLPPLQEQLYLPDNNSKNSGEGDVREMTVEEQLQKMLQREEEALARELAGGRGGGEHLSDSEGENVHTPRATNASTKGKSSVSKKMKSEKKDKGNDKPKVGRSQWGMPTIRVRDSQGRIIEVNSREPVPVETDFFKGVILIMLRTEGDLEKYNHYEHHFKGKQRKFEVQFQGSMKNVPEGEVMLGGELQEKMDISFVTRAMLSVITKFCMSLNPFLHFGFGETPREDNLFELPHLTFPLFRVMDRVIVTPPGGELPKLGQELQEDEQQRKDRRAGRGDVLSFKEGYTYSFSFHSMYVDFSRWAICNFPGYKAIDIRGFLGQQHVNVVCYEISQKDLMATGKAQHYNAHKRYLLTLELKHELCMTPEELEEADRDDLEVSDDSEIDDDENDSDDDDGDDSNVLSSDEDNVQYEGDEMDEESLVIAQEMNEDQRDFDDSDLLDAGELSTELMHMPDESELIEKNSVVSLIAIPAPWEPWDYLTEKSAVEEIDEVDKSLSDPRELGLLPPHLYRGEGSHIMHGNTTTHEDSGLSPKRTCFGIAEVGDVAMRKECSSLPAVRFIPVTPPHISTSRLARLSLRRNQNQSQNSSQGAPRRKSMLSALYSRRRNTSHVERHATITPTTTAATDKNPPAGLRCGDAVQIQSASSGRYLTVHKGWWVGWCTEEYQPTSSSKHNRIAAKSLFTIHPTDSTGLKYMPHGTPLVAGMPFRLRSVRWPDWEVGCCEPGRQSGHRESPIVLYYAKIKVRHQVPISGPTKWHNSTKKVNPLCLSVMHDENDDRRRSMSSGSLDMVMSSPTPVDTGSKRFYGVSPSRIVSTVSSLGIDSTPNTDVSTGSILTQFLAPLEVGGLENPGGELNISVSGWVEVLNRSLNYSQLAYIISVTYKHGDECSKVTKWTTLRTQKDLEEIFSRIDASVKREEKAEDEYENIESSLSTHHPVNYTCAISENEAGDISNDHTGRSSSSGKDQWSVMDREEEDRLAVGVNKGSILGSTTSTLQRAKRSILRRSRVNIQRHDIAPNHLYPADQNVIIMSNRIKKALRQDRKRVNVALKSNFNSSESLASCDDNNFQKSLVRQTSLDDGSGTRKSRNNESLDAEGEHLIKLKGYLSDSSIPMHSPSPSTTSGICTNSREPDPESTAAPLADEDDEFTSTQFAEKIFIAALSVPQILDTWFLSDDSEKYLRAPPPPKKGPVRQQIAIVARALWDSHWREEIAVIYPSYIAFYPLLAKKASWTLYLQELIGISHVDDATSPLPGFPILRIETIGRLHYLAFSSKDICNSVAANVLEHFSEITFDSSMPTVGEMGDPRDRFVLTSGRWRPAGRRLILNARKFLFDVDDKVSNTVSGDNGMGNLSTEMEMASRIDFSEKGSEPYWKFAERLLQDVFRLELNNSCDSEGLFPGREMIIKFLDETVKLKQINLQKDINFSSPEALCFFANIYHTLLMHARLVLGPPNQQDWTRFFDTICYEIGSDVFSLSEIEHCVLGGRLARPINTPRHFPAVPRVNDDHYLYALPTADRRMRFLVNYGSISQLPTIYLMTPEKMHDALNESSVAFFESSLEIDMKRRTVTLPRICDSFSMDFGENPLAVLRHVLRYLNRDNWEKVSILLDGSKSPVVKYHDLKPRSHSRLHLVTQK